MCVCLSVKVKMTRGRMTLHLPIFTHLYLFLIPSLYLILILSHLMSLKLWGLIGKSAAAVPKYLWGSELDHPVIKTTLKLGRGT